MQKKAQRGYNFTLFHLALFLHSFPYRCLQTKDEKFSDRSKKTHTQRNQVISDHLEPMNLTISANENRATSQSSQ